MTELVVNGVEFVVIPKQEYLSLKLQARGVDAVAYASDSIASGLRKAREAAGLTQAELAKRMKRSQALISSAESGAKDVGMRYVKSVLAACGLPDDWKP